MSFDHTEIKKKTHCSEPKLGTPLDANQTNPSENLYNNLSSNVNEELSTLPEPNMKPPIFAFSSFSSFRTDYRLLLKSGPTSKHGMTSFDREVIR